MNMFTYDEMERKSILILRILNHAGQPLGARIIARRMKEYGINLSERAVRYHLQFMDQRELTRFIGRRVGRLITEKGIEELRNARVQDKVGYCISRMEILAYKTTFDATAGKGLIPSNVSFFPKESFKDALKGMKPAFDKGYCVSNLVAVAPEGAFLGDVHVPPGCIGFATVCSIVFSGMLLKRGIPTESKFGGILQVSEHKPMRFVELIHYSGTSLDPSEAFISARMTTVRDVLRRGEGKILANFSEVAGVCRDGVEEIIKLLKGVDMQPVISMGKMGESVCQASVDVNKMGIILLGGLNPVASAREAGVEETNLPMSTVMDYKELRRFSSVYREYLG
jgi:HTH-type transcriptional regulator, global nitrogen regulator NrpRI